MCFAQLAWELCKVQLLWGPMWQPAEPGLADWIGMDPAGSCVIQLKNIYLSS